MYDFWSVMLGMVLGFPLYLFLDRIVFPVGSRLVVGHCGSV